MENSSSKSTSVPSSSLRTTTTTTAPTSTPPPSKILHIGILGAANIARKNIRAIQHSFNHPNCKLVAIASRSSTKAFQFVKDHVSRETTNAKDNSTIRIFTGENAYNDLLSCTDADLTIDAVYIPLPTTLHLQYVKAALNAKKHVLIEKPVSTTINEYKEMLDLAMSVDKFIMDGTMFVHNPRTNHLLTQIHHNDGNGSVDLSTNNENDILRIQSDFTFSGNHEFFNHNIRISSKGDLLGCIGDLGWYCIRMAQLVFSKTSYVPTSAQVVHYELNDDDVPIDATCIVMFEQKVNDNREEEGEGQSMKVIKNRTKILSFHCSFIHPLNQSISMIGTKHSIHLDDFVISRKEAVNAHTKLSFLEKSQTLSFADMYSIHTENVKQSTTNDDVEGGIPQEVRMWSNFAKYCRGTDANDAMIMKEGKELQHVSFENQCVVNALMNSIRKGGEKVMIERA